MIYRAEEIRASFGKLRAGKSTRDMFDLSPMPSSLSLLRVTGGKIK